LQFFKKARDSVSLGAKNLRGYAEEKLRENMGQSESKERGFKQVLKTLEARF
jgi:hypothetical protein